jgi:hypothetical protein
VRAAGALAPAATLTWTSCFGGYNGPVANPLTRRFAVRCSLVVLVAALAAGTLSTTDETAFARPTQARALEADLGVTPRVSRLAQAGPSFRGGPITTSTGETVEVYVSDNLAPEDATPEGWAGFLAGLTHGSELGTLTAYVVTFAEVQEICGSRALGCYGADRLVVPGELAADISPEEVVRHEYGHHVAYHRLNAPWAAIDWGPKRWASAANVCAKVSRREAYPGDEGSNYARNPGEAWAETYRLMDERKVGITTGTWPIIAPSFYPDDPALLAAEEDVVRPWAAQRTTLATRVFGKTTAKVWWIPLEAALDGDVRVSATLPSAGTYDVALVGSNRRTVVKRAQWIGQRVKRLDASICGQRSLFVRVTQKGSLGRVRVSVTAP